MTTPVPTETTSRCPGWCADHSVVGWTGHWLMVHEGLPSTGETANLSVQLSQHASNGWGPAVRVLHHQDTVEVLDAQQARDLARCLLEAAAVAEGTETSL